MLPVLSHADPIYFHINISGVIVSCAFISLKFSLACRYSNKNVYALSPMHAKRMFDLTSRNCFLTFRSLLIISHLGELLARGMIFFPAVRDYPLFKIFSAALLQIPGGHYLPPLCVVLEKGPTKEGNQFIQQIHFKILI